MENLKEVLRKIEDGCSICKAKLCSSCPNDRKKKKIKEELKALGEWEEEKSFLQSLKEWLEKRFKK